MAKHQTQTPIKMSPTLKIRAYAELVRPPALCTASADSWAGIACMCTLMTLKSSSIADFMQSSHGWYWLGYIPGISLPALCYTLCISMLIYAAGMVSNDLFDHKIDLEERPQRPIPSGRVNRWEASLLMLTLQTGALFIAYQLDIVVVYAALATIISTYAYNYIFKMQWISPFIMGICRGCNFWIGLCVAWVLISKSITLDHTVEDPALNLLIVLTQPSVGLITIGSIIYVMTLTMVSTYEVTGGVIAQRRSKVLCALSLLPLCYWVCNILNVWAWSCLLITWILYKAMQPLLNHVDGDSIFVRQVVMAGIRGVALMNAVICCGFGFYMYGILLVVLTLSAKYVARWFYAT